MSKRLFYPAILEVEETGYSVYFPDIQGCNTCGENMENAYEMAQDALGLMLSYMQDNKEPIPVASSPQDIKLAINQFVVIVEFDMEEYIKRNHSRAVKKTLSIPSWLNEQALDAGLNFSQVLQEALQEKLNA